MPNVDPKQLKNMMAKMGIKTTEIDAQSVTIHCSDKDIVITSPQVTKIEAQGAVSFQVAGQVNESVASDTVVVTEDDISTVMQQTGVSDKETVVRALEEANGDIAQAILSLKS